MLSIAGFLIESSPGGNIGFEPDFKLTTELVELMGGDQNAPAFKFERHFLDSTYLLLFSRYFVDLMTRAYLAVRPYQEQFLSIIALMLETKLPCFRSDKVLEGVR
jgi:phosphatidylinositol 4-kinase